MPGILKPETSEIISKTLIPKPIFEPVYGLLNSIPGNQTNRQSHNRIDYPKVDGLRKTKIIMVTHFMHQIRNKKVIQVQSIADFSQKINPTKVEKPGKWPFYSISRHINQHATTHKVKR